jgi:hypothetical protein
MRRRKGRSWEYTEEKKGRERERRRTSRGGVKEEVQGGEAEGRETAWRKIRGKGGQKWYDEKRTRREGEEEGVQSASTIYVHMYNVHSYMQNICTYIYS